VYHSAWVNDTWKINNRLTLNLGGRLENYIDEWNEQQFQPNGHPALANWPADLNPAERTRYMNFVAPVTVEARTVADTWTFAPRAGFAFDLTGDNRTVLKAFFGQSRWNSADTLADQENPVGRAQLRYNFRSCTAGQTVGCDLNNNRLLDSAYELGTFVSTQGGGGFVTIDRELERPTTNELSVNVEREIKTALSGRVSYVYKNMRNVWGEVDTVRTPAYTVPYSFVDPGPDNALNTGNEQTFQTYDRPATIGSNRVYTNPENNKADFHTMEFAVNRRFSGKWMLLSSFGYTWSNMLHDTTGNGRFYSYRPSRRMFGDENGFETSTLWNYKIIGRYTMPWDIGFSGSWKVQSGVEYGRTVSVPFPGDGTQTVRVESINANRYPTVQILDMRADKTFSFGRYGRITAMVDAFNLTNASTATTVRVTTVNYQEVTAILDPRIFRFGVRYSF
jgi:hypothetical protein